MNFSISYEKNINININENEKAILLSNEDAFDESDLGWAYPSVLFLSSSLTLPHCYSIFIVFFTFLFRKCSKFYTMYSCLSKILENERSETANNPFLVSYLPWISILVGLVSHKGNPLMSSSTILPSPQTSIADKLLYSFTYSSIYGKCYFLFSYSMKLSSYGHMYSGVASLYCFKLSYWKDEP